MPGNLQNSAVATGWEKSVFISIPKKDSAKFFSNYQTIALKILQARLQQYMNWELPDVQAGFIKAEEPESKSFGSQKKQGKKKKNKTYFCFIDYAKAFDCVDHNKPWKIIKEMGIPDYLTCLLRILYAG